MNNVARFLAVTLGILFVTVSAHCDAKGLDDTALRAFLVSVPCFWIAVWQPSRKMNMKNYAGPAKVHVTLTDNSSLTFEAHTEIKWTDTDRGNPFVIPMTRVVVNAYSGPDWAVTIDPEMIVKPQKQVEEEFADQLNKLTQSAIRRGVSFTRVTEILQARYTQAQDATNRIREMLKLV